MENLPDVFDRKIGELHGLPDVLNSKPSNHSVVEPAVGNALTFTVQTYRHKEQGDFIFITRVSKDGSVRLYLPPEVANAIARQRDALTARARSKAAKAVAAERKARGILPGFMRKSMRNNVKAAARHGQKKSE